jgi:hypothetical protein
MLYPEENQIVGFKLKKPENSLQNRMVAMAKSLAKAQIKWTANQKKLFIMVLTKIDWSKSGNSNVVELDKNEIIDALKLNINASDKSIYLRNEFRKLATNSFVSWTSKEDRDIWEDGFLFVKWGSSRNKMNITINQDYMPLLENLVGTYQFLTMWSNDMYSFKSKFSFALFEELRMNYDNRYFTNERDYTTKQLKELFGLTKDDYMNGSSGKFDRFNFEKYTLNVAMEEINAGEMIKIIKIEKIKKNGRVMAYRILYTVKTRTTPTQAQLNAQAEDEELERQEREELQGQEKFTNTDDFDKYVETITKMQKSQTDN